MTYFNDAKRRSEAGVAKNCMATHGLSQRGNQRMSDLDIAYTLSTPFSAGVETVRRFLFKLPRRYELSERCPQTLSVTKWGLSALSGKL